MKSPAPPGDGQGLHATQTDLEELFRQAPAFFALLRGPNHVFERVNEAYLQLVAHRDVLGKPLLEALPEIKGQGFDKLLDEVMATGTPFVGRAIEASVVRTRGSAPEKVYVDFIYQPLRDSRGEITGVIAHGSDVTKQVLARADAEEKALELLAQVDETQAIAVELEQSVEQLREMNTELTASEEQFRTALNAIPALAWIANADGWIFWYNRQWYEYTGTAPADMEGWGWESVHDPAILPDVLERWTASITTGEPFEMEFPLRSASGKFRWFLTRVSPLRDSQGQIRRWFGTNTDVHLQREATEAARAANQAKTDFLAAMSHETRQPINATIGFLDVLEMGMYGPVPEKQREALSRIRTNQEQLLRVITDILSFARLEAGQVKLDNYWLSCAEILEAVPALVEPQVASRGLSLIIEPCPASLAVFGDKNRILQICTNLIMNALRATEKGGKISLRFLPRGRWVDLEVEDTGSGIPEDKLEHIFAPFVQLGRTLNHPREGVGLGLAISRDLARDMGGNLTVRSTVGVGSVFTLALPQDETT